MLSFGEFFAAIRPEDTPYPWQIRFAEACASDAPPRLVAVPTGTGKTTVLDALIWALAAQAERPAHERTVGCRIVWAIDRRILVDEVHEWTCRLANRLHAASGDRSNPLHPVATSLQRLAGDDGATPLVATRWRGGIEDERPLLSPTQPQVITSTIAQIGSRLLFRGYGVGRRSLKLQAGLAACDTNVCLDEAHLAQPFVETVEAIRESRVRHEGDIPLPPLTTITLTATPPAHPEGAIELGPEDRTALGSRLMARKVARLDDTAKTERERAAQIADLAVSYVEGGARRVACVVNTVRQAITVHAMLQTQKKDDDWDLALLIGPQRPVDREQVLAGPAASLFPSSEEEDPPDKPVLCVATQTFEVGLDADVEALVTESASASALVQRLGRLNRRGESEGRATIVRDPGSWLYGEDEELAWQWLLSRRDDDGQIDVSVAALEEDETRPVPLAPPLAPELTDETVELLVQTNPLPGPFQDPDVEPFLTGADSEPASDASICWRCDLRFDDDVDHNYRKALLEQAPPVASERVAISLRGARMLLAALHPDRSTNRKTAMQTAVAEPDVEGPTTDSKLPPLAADAKARFVVIRRGQVLKGALRNREPDTISPSQLAPGDTIVLPSELGGEVADLKAPWVSNETTRDSAPDVRSQAVEPKVVRISPEAFEAAEGSREPAEIKAPQWNRIKARCREAEATGPDGRQEIVRRLANDFDDYVALGKLLKAAEYGIELRFEMVGSSALDADEPFPTDEDPNVIDEDEQWDELSEPSPDDPKAERSGPTWVIRAVLAAERDRVQRKPTKVPTIAAHAEAVTARVSSYCRRLCMDAGLTATLELAAKVHDHGKADRRIQDFYRGGAPSIAEAPIAKSFFGTDDRQTSRRAAERAGLPDRLHHEIASAAILLDAVGRDPGLCRPGVDLSLVAYLVRGHHGRGQPFPGVPINGDPPSGMFCDAAGIAGSARGNGIEDWDSGEPLELFWEVTRRYGAWGSAYLLSILMIADRTVSSEGH